MNKKLPLATALVTLAAGGSAAALANAQTPSNPYAPGTTPVPPTTTVPVPVTPALPRPLITVSRALKDIGADLRAIRASRRTKVKVELERSAPGEYSVIVYRRGTAVKLLTGSRDLKGTVVKPAKINLTITKTGRSYFKRLKAAGRDTVRADLRVRFDPKASGPTTTRRSVITIGL